MPGRREHIQIHRISPLAPVETQIYTCICFLTQRPHYARRAPMDDDVKVLERIYDRFNARDIDGVLAALTDDVAWANGMDGGHVHGSEAVRARSENLRVGQECGRMCRYWGLR